MAIENNTLTTNFNWSVEVTIITLTTIAIILGIIISFYSKWPANLSILKYLITIIILSIILIPSMYTPIRLSINNEKIVLKRVIGNIEINLNDIKSVTPISNREISNSIRTFGSGGLFGYIGQFKNNIFGNYTMYATEKKNLIYINTKKEKYIISCSKSHEFTELANKKMKK